MVTENSSPSDIINFQGQAGFKDCQDILYNAPIGVFTSTPDGRFLSVNPAMARMYGYESPQEMIELVTDIGHQLYADTDDRECFKLYIEQHGEVKDQEFKMIRRDGSLIWVSVSGRCARDPDGEITQYQGFITNITERKITQEKSSISKQTLVTILESLPAEVYVSDLQDHTVLYMNNSMKRSFGRDCIGETCYEVFNNAASPCSHCKKAMLLDNQNRPTGIVSWEWYNPIARKWYKTEDQVIPWDGEKFAHIQLATDITDHKQAEEAFEKKSKELELYFTSSLDLLCIANTDGKFIRLNPEWESVLGYSISELEGRVFLDFVHPEDMEPTIAAVSRLKNQEHVLNFVNRFCCRDGSYRWIEWRSRSLGRQIYAAARDITERKRAEAKLQESEENLARTLQSIGDGVISTDTEGRVVRMNPVAEKLCGWSESEAKGHFLGEVFRIVNANTRQPLDDPVQKVFASGQVVGLANHTLLLSKDDMEYQIADSAAPIKDRKGDIAGAVLVFRDVTQDYAREKVIKDEREQLLSIFNSIEGMIYISDPKTYEILYVNNKLAILLPEDCIGTRCYKTFQGLEEPCEFCTNHIILGNKLQPYKWEYYNPALDRHFSIVDRIIKWSDGRDVRFEMAIDITERKQAESKLRESEERFSKAFKSSPAPLVISDVDTGRFIDVNDCWVKMLGYSKEDQIGRTSKEVGIWVNPDERVRIVHKLKIYGRFKDEPIKFKTKDGQILTALWSAEAVAFGGQQVMLSMINDETERRSAEQALRASEDRLANVMAAINDGIWDLDIENNCVYFDPRYYTMAGYAPDSFPASFEEFERRVHPDDLELVQSSIANHFSGQNPVFDVEFRFLKRDGVWFWVRSRGSIVRRDEQGNPARMVGTHTDITDRRLAEEEREKLQFHLIQAQKMESLGTLAGGVAHDFNNLLQTMGGNIELLLQGKPSDHPDAARLQNVARSINRAAQLVRQLLLFSRKAEFTKVPVDLNQEVKEAVRILERTIPKMIALELNLDQALWPLRADPVQIEQVLLNLASNAVDAMPDGGRMVIETSNVILDENFVRTHPGSTAERHVLLSVTDTGCGMDKKTLGHVFDPFFTTKEVGKGTGLGLPSVHGIVKGHGGHIQCYSEPGLGTVFKIYLPASEKVEVVTELPCSEITPSEGSETIFVVDDEPEILELTGEALKSLGYAVKSAASGEDALKVYQNHIQHIDLVLLDLNMPGMGGHKCLEELLQLDPLVKVIIASGYTVNGYGKDALSSGARGFIGKPYQLRELAATVRRVLDS